MLAGYTAAIIGFPSVNRPEAVFDVAQARVTEIVLGITCARSCTACSCRSRWGPGSGRVSCVAA
jgi:hypothetical protein